MTRLRSRWSWACMAACVVACSPLLGLTDPSLEAEDSPSGDDASGDAGDASSSEASPDGSACEHTRDDPANCGECGRDCLGSICVDGACLPFSTFLLPASMTFFNVEAGGGYVLVFSYGSDELTMIRADGSAYVRVTVGGVITDAVVDEPGRRLFVRISNGDLFEAKLEPGSGPIPSPSFEKLPATLPATFQHYAVPAEQAMRPIVTQNIVGWDLTLNTLLPDGGLREVGRMPLTDCANAFWSSGDTLYFGLDQDIVARAATGATVRHDIAPYGVCGGVRPVGDALYFVLTQYPNYVVARKGRGASRVEILSAHDAESDDNLVGIASGKKHFYWAAGRRIYRCPEAGCQAPEIVVDAPKNLRGIEFGNGRLYYYFYDDGQIWALAE